jgi:hypothetical protein
MFPTMFTSWPYVIRTLGWLFLNLTVVTFAINVVFMLAMMLVVGNRKIGSHHIKGHRPAPSFVKGSILYWGLITGPLRTLEIVLVLLVYCVPILSWYLAVATAQRAAIDSFYWITGRTPAPWPSKDEYFLQRHSWLDELGDKHHRDATR